MKDLRYSRRCCSSTVFYLKKFIFLYSFLFHILYFQNSSSGGGDNLKEGDFDWSSKLKGVMLSSFYYGYAAGQVPSGIIAGKVGGKTLMGLSLIFSSVATLLTHVAATTNVAILIALRILLGLLLSANYPAAMVLMGYWSYDNENTILTGSTYMRTKIT